MNHALANLGLLLASGGFITAFAAMPLRKLRLYCAAMAVAGTGFLTEASALHIVGFAIFGGVWVEGFGLLWLRFSGARLPGRPGRLLAAVPAFWPFNRRGGA